MLKFDNVDFEYELGNPILKNLSFEINKGDFVALVGKSGCGKSTIFRLILGFEKLLSGKIIKSEENARIGFMPQKDLLFPWRNVKENLAISLEIQKLSKSEIEERVEKILDDMDLSETAKLYPSDLSGGMRQRIAFARTVLTGAELLLLDEPFSALDYFTRLDFQEWITKQYLRLNKTIVLITHSVDEAILLGNRVFIFDKKPVSNLTEINISLPYPRTQEMLNEKHIFDMKTSLIRKLRMEA